MYYGLNRYLCEVLEEMRTAYKTYNFSIMLSLIEEAQTMGSRMEAALHDQKDLKKLREEIEDKKKEYLKLEKNCKELEAKMEELREEAKTEIPEKQKE